MTDDRRKTKAQLIKELESLRQENAELKATRSEHKGTEERLRLFLEAVEKAPDGIQIVDLDGHIVYSNKAVEAIYGYTAEECLGKHVDEINVNPEFASTAIIPSIKETGQWAGELMVKHKNGREFPIWLTASMIGDDKGEPTAMVGMIRDITDRKRAEETVANLAFHDALTGLPNRLLLNDRLSLAIAHAQRNQQKVAVMMLDLDRFKNVNDAWGHSMGDHLLKSVAHLITSLLRKSDTAARIGGDEFMLLLPELTQVEDTATIAEKILKALREPFLLDGREIQTSTSMGIAIYPNDGEEADTLMRNADIAMYHSKEAGRDNYRHYTTAVNTKAQE